MPIKYKPYLLEKSPYIGGKSKSEVTTDQVIKLSSNENQLGASPKAIAAIQKHIHSLSEYPDGNDDRFRSALSKYYNGALGEDQFVTTNSGVANIELIIRGFMEEGDECIYSNPAFSPYQNFPKKVGGHVINVPLLGDDFELDVRGILDKVNEKTRLIFITSPNNPTGTHLPKFQVDELVYNIPDWVVLVFDEVYFQFADAHDFVRPLTYVKEGKNVIGVNSFSKAYGLAGLRIGYSYSTAEIATYLSELRRPFMLNRLSMEAAIAALDDTAFISESVSLIHIEKAFLYGRLDAMGVKYWPTQANFIMIKPEIDIYLFEKEMLDQGIMVRPVADFGAPGCVRVTIGKRSDNVAFLNAYNKLLE